MKVSVLCAQHPTHRPDVGARYDALYRGGEAFHAQITHFLPRNPAELDDVYDARKKEAHYTGYVGPIVDWFSAKLCSSPIVVRPRVDDGVEADAKPVEADPWYAGWKEDVDGARTDLMDFVRARFTAACVKGRSWWCVELPDDGLPQPENRAQWEERGLGGAYIYPLEDAQVCDWEVDARGLLLWAIVHTQETRRDDPRAGDRGVITETWRIYDRTDVETWEIVWDPSKDQRPEDARLVGRKAHGFSRVPIVRLGFVGTRGVKVKVGQKTVNIAGAALEGFWLLNRLAGPQVAHFRNSAALDWNIKRTCYAMPVFGIADPDKPPVMGAGYGICIGVEEKVAWIAPPTDHLAVLSQRVDHLKQEIYRVANQLAQGVDNNAAAIGRSGESKLADSTATEVVLRVYGAIVREAIEETYDLLADGRGDATRFSIEGLDTFNVADAAAVVDTVVKAQTLKIPSVTARREMLYRAVDALLPDVEQATKEQIHEEIEAGVTEESMRAEDEAAEKAAAALAKPAEDDAEPQSTPEPKPAITTKEAA